MGKELTLEERIERIEDIISKEKDVAYALTSKQKKQRKKIYEQLCNKIKLMNYDDSHAIKLALIDSYMEMWEIERKLVNNVKIKGIEVLYFDKNGNMLYKRNDAIPSITAYNKQMLMLLKEMGLNTNDIESVQYDAGDDRENL